MALLLAMTTIYPAYINVAVVDNAQSSRYYDVDHMKQQTLDWLLFSLPLAVALGLAVARAVTLQSARDLYGAGSPAERALAQAWTSVGVE